MKNTPVLAFDCSTPAASVALRVHGHIYQQDIPHGRQAAELVSAIDALMKAHGVTYAQLGSMVTTIGPGSFTGLRIALATLHGLVLAVPTPVKTITSLEAVAWDVARRLDAPGKCLIVLNAGKGEVFCQSFALSHGTPIAEGDISMIAPTDIPSGLAAYGNTQAEGSAHFIAGPSASVLCTIEERLAETHIEDALPLYIRPPDAKVPKPFAWFSKEAS